MSCHSAIGFSPTVLFHGREPIKPLDLRFNKTLIERFSPKSEYVIALQDAMNKTFSETKLKLTEMYNKYRACYDCKAEAKPLALFSYCLLLKQKLMTQSDFSSKLLPIWLPLYRIEKILTHSIYIIGKVGTIYTQCVHRIRFRTVTPQGRIDDLTLIDFKNFHRDLSLGHYRGEPTLFDESIPSLLEPPTTVVATQTVTEGPPPVTVSLRFPLAPAPVPVGLAASLAPQETSLMHLILNRDHYWHLSLQRPCLLLIKAPSEFPQLVLIIVTIVTAQLILRAKTQFTSVIFVLLFNLKVNRRSLLVQIYQNLMIFDRDYHRGIIMRKSFKTKYRLKYVVFQLLSQLPHRSS